MIPALDLSLLPPLAQGVLAEGADDKRRLVAARGLLPGLKPADIVTVLTALTQGRPGEVATTARATIAKLPPALLEGAVGAELQPAAIDALARAHGARDEVLSRLLRMPAVALDTVEWVAEHGSEPATELVATNEERALAHPRLIELLYLNVNTRMSTADRLVELAVRHGIELKGLAAWKEIARGVQGELIAEPTPVPLPEDELFRETHALALQIQSDEDDADAYVEDDEGEERLEDRCVPIFKRLLQMNVSQKIRMAILGTREERMMLIREHNRLIAGAAATSPKMTEPEAVLISRNRGVDSEVLRVIGRTPEWLKSYMVKKNLVENPKTPQTVPQTLIVHLREADLKNLLKSKNVSAAIALAAKRQLERRKQ
ncbi:MAG: hypothetical protein HY744_14035 [Deltaproteobacteria bacterium]|nr:hypothetical protein [Deltaproteobacteria bacterium]